MQLPLFKRNEKDLANMSVLERWAYFFKHAEGMLDQEVDELIGEDIILKKAYKELDRFGWSQQELNSYDSVEMKKAAD